MLKLALYTLQRLGNEQDPIVTKDKALPVKDRFVRELQDDDSDMEDDDGTTLQSKRPLPFQGGIIIAARNNFFKHLISSGSYCTAMYRKQPAVT